MTDSRAALETIQHYQKTVRMLTKALAMQLLRDKSLRSDPAFNDLLAAIEQRDFDRAIVLLVTFNTEATDVH